MKTRKGIAAVLAGVMALAALPFSALSASAESAYAPGDVDMDGYITAHDAAVVSRALYVDETALNDEQKQLADVNGDGVVDQTDADWIYEHSEYKLGAVNQKEYMSSTTLFYQMYYIARKGAGYHDALLTDGSIPESFAEENEVYHDNCITQVCYNLLDVNGDGVLDIDDVYVTAFTTARCGAGLSNSFYLVKGRYDLDADTINRVCEADQSGYEVSNRDYLMKELDLQEVVYQAIAKNKAFLIQNGMRITVRTECGTVFCDEKWLIFILSQILINAAKYKKGEKGTIRVDAEDIKNGVQLAISDEGVGIRREELVRIFDKGFTGTNGRGSRASTGMGLYLCRKLCEKLGIQIHAESEEGKGMKMILRFPKGTFYERPEPVKSEGNARKRSLSKL